MPVSLDGGRSPVARGVGEARRGKPLPSAAQFQAHRRRVAARVRGSAPACACEGGIADGTSSDGSDLRRRIQLGRPLLRTSGREARHAAGDVREGRGRHVHRLRCRRFTARAADGGRNGSRGLRHRDGRYRPVSRARTSARVPASAHRTRHGAIDRLDGGGPGASGWQDAPPRSSARYSGDRVRMAGVACAQGHSDWRDTFLCGDCRRDRPAGGGSRRRASMRCEPRCAGNSLSSGRAVGGRHRRLSVGGGPQEATARARAAACRKPLQ